MSQSRNLPTTHQDDVINPPVPPRDLEIFRARLDAGDYDALLGRRLRSSLRQAAQETSLDPEIGALRLAMVRLLREELDPTRLANGISRLANVSVRAAHLRPSASDDLSAHLQRVLAEIDAEKAAANQHHDNFRVASITLPADQELA